MRWKSMKRASIALGLLSLAGCDPAFDDPGYGVSLSNPSAGQEPVPLTFTTNAQIEGGFTLVESGCDPGAFTVDLDHGVLVPDWSPYDCGDADGRPAPDQGNIQLHVDGFFLGYFTSEAIEVDLSPKLSFAYYEPQEIDEDNDPVTAPTTQDVFVCNFYYPADNQGYAEALYESFMAATHEDLYEGAPLYEIDGDGKATTKPDTVVYDLFGAVGAPWLFFSYAGMYDPATESVIEQHVFSTELHYDNHEAVAGAGRQRIITGGFDTGALPDDWCGSGVQF